MRNLNVALVQYSPEWENAVVSCQNLDLILETLSPNTQLVLLPEMFNSGFSMNTNLVAEKMDGKTMKWLAEKSNKCAIAGTLAISTDRGIFNRLCVFKAGKLLGYYDKKYLFGMGMEDQHYQAGDTQLNIVIEGFSLQFYTCYDLRFPEWSRNYEQYDAAIYLASWPEKRIAHWNALLKARAIENQAYTLGVNRTGIDGNNLKYAGNSQVFSPMGEILNQETSNSEIVYVNLKQEIIHQTRTQLPFLKDIK